MQRELLEPTRRRRRGAVAAIVAGVLAAGAFVAWGAVRWERAARQEVVLDASVIDGDGAFAAGRADYLIIPARSRRGPPSPEERMAARLDAFAERVDAARRGSAPPLKAFGAQELREELEAIIANVDERARVSVHVRDLSSARVLFDYDGDRALNPASNHKVLTSAAALDLLGEDFEFETRVLRVGADLYLVGGGDPTIDGDALRELAAQVAERVTVNELERIVIDDTAFTERQFGPGYSTGGDGVSYMAPSGALSANFNTVEITVYPASGTKTPLVRLEPDSTHAYVVNRSRYSSSASLAVSTSAIAWPEPGPRHHDFTRVEIEGGLPQGSRGYRFRRRVADPGMFTGGAFARALADVSHSEALPVREGRAPVVEELDELDVLELLDSQDDGGGLPRSVHRSEGPDVELVALRRSPPLSEIVAGLLAYSNNFIAEQLLRTLGWKTTGQPGGWDNGGAVLRGYWEAVGNAPEELRFENGSGLSRVGRVSAAGLVEVLASSYRTHEGRPALFEALPVAGSKGTLGGRLLRSGQRVRAKTGTLDGVSGLTGVITAESGEPQVAFSILINAREDWEGTGLVAPLRREVEDAIVMAVLRRIDSWEVTRGTLLDGLEPIDVRPVGRTGADASGGERPSGTVQLHPGHAPVELRHEGEPVDGSAGVTAP